MNEKIEEEWYPNDRKIQLLDSWRWTKMAETHKLQYNVKELKLENWEDPIKIWGWKSDINKRMKNFKLVIVILR